MTKSWIRGTGIPGFNGGKSQVNPNALGYDGAFATINLLKTGQGWGFIDLASYKFDSDGYPTDVSAGAISMAFYVPPTTERAWTTGCITVSWSGSGTLTLGGLVLDSGTLIHSGAGPWSVTCHPTGPSSNTTLQCTVGISAIGSSTDYIHDIKVYFTDDQPLIAAGQIWSPKYLARLRQLNCGVIRFLCWGDSNGGDGYNDCNVTTWASRKPLTYICWQGPEPRYAWYAGTTTNVGDAFSLTTVGTYAFGSAFPSDKQTAIVKWSGTATTSSPTLSWNGGTAKAILAPTGTAPQFSTGKPGSGFYSTLVYDAALDAFLNFGTSASTEWLETGVPPEMAIDLCRNVGAHPDFPLPFLAADPLTDWTSNLISAISAYGSPWMIPRFEGVNECWNNAAAFYGTYYGRQRQLLRNGATNSNGVITNPTYTPTAVSYVAQTSMTITLNTTHTYQIGSHVSLGGTWTGLFGMISDAYVTSIPAGNQIVLNSGPNGGTWTSGGNVTSAPFDENDWYGLHLSNLGQTVASAYGVAMANVKTQSKYQICCGVHTGTGNIVGSNAGGQLSGSGCSASNPRLASTFYVLNSGVANNAAKNWATHVRVTCYFNSNLYDSTIGNTNEASLATTFGGVLFGGTVSAGTLTVSSFSSAGASLAIGMTLLPVGGVPSAGITITSGSAPTWTISNNSFNLGAGAALYACTTPSAAQTFIDGINNPPTFTGSVSGTVLTASAAGLIPISSNTHPLSLRYSGGSMNSNIINDNGDGTYNLDRNLGTLASQAMSADTADTLNTLPTIFANWKAWAQAFGIQKLNCYEGGYSPDYFSPSGAALTKGDPLLILRFAGKLVTSSPLSPTGMAGYLTGVYNAITGLTDGTFTGEFPSLFLLSGFYPSGEDWPILEDIYQTPDPPQVTAIQAFNKV